MSLLSLDVSKCVHTSNKFASCDKCVTACPVDTIKIAQHAISFTPSECVGCGGCSAICPTAAYSLDDFSPLNYCFEFLQEQNSTLTCKGTTLPCIAALSVEELMSLALLSAQEISLDIGPCTDCPIAQTNLQIIHERAQEVNFLLEAIESKRVLHVEALNYEVQEESPTISRRELLSKNSLKHALSIKQQFENRVASSDEDVKTHAVTVLDIKKIKEKNLPDRRSLLLMAFKRAKVPEVFHTLSVDDISFISQKDLNEDTCTNCQMCYRICPTGALSSDAKASVINFNPLACVQCQSCHDVCEPDALTLRKTFSLSSFFEPKVETLVRFTIKRCDECGNFFAYKGGEVICPRCKIEEEEAKSLWGIE